MVFKAKLCSIKSKLIFKKAIFFKKTNKHNACFQANSLVDIRRFNKNLLAIYSKIYPPLCFLLSSS